MILKNIPKTRTMVVRVVDTQNGVTKNKTINVADNATPEGVLHELLNDASEARHARKRKL